MPIYVALPRGVNVGQNILRMDRLREVCSEMGLKNVRTYVQSGNVVFEGQGSATRWSQALERGLAGETRLPVTVIVRTAAEIAKVLAENPFQNSKEIRCALSELLVGSRFAGKAHAITGEPALDHCSERGGPIVL